MKLHKLLVKEGDNDECPLAVGIYSNIKMANRARDLCPGSFLMNVPIDYIPACPDGMLAWEVSVDGGEDHVWIEQKDMFSERGWFRQSEHYYLNDIFYREAGEMCLKLWAKSKEDAEAIALSYYEKFKESFPGNSKGFFSPEEWETLHREKAVSRYPLAEGVDAPPLTCYNPGVVSAENMPTYQIVTPDGVVTRPCPEVLPEPGQTYAVQRPFVTTGGLTYYKNQQLTLEKRTTDAPYGYASSLGNWEVTCPYWVSVWSGIEEMISMGDISLVGPSSCTSGDASTSSVEEKILSIIKSYHEEIGISTKGDAQDQVAELVNSHRNIRENFRTIFGEYQDARKQGYQDGLRMGSKAADSQYISIEDLRAMSLAEISKLIGEC